MSINNTLLSILAEPNTHAFCNRSNAHENHHHYHYHHHHHHLITMVLIIIVIFVNIIIFDVLTSTIS